MTITHTSIQNWLLEEVGSKGRFAKIRDEYETYIAKLPAVNRGGDKYDLDDAISEFASTYDLGDATENVHCSARLYIDGIEVEFQQFEIEVE